MKDEGIFAAFGRECAATLFDQPSSLLCKAGAAGGDRRLENFVQSPDLARPARRSLRVLVGQALAACFASAIALASGAASSPRFRSGLKVRSRADDRRVRGRSIESFRRRFRSKASSTA